MLNSLPTIGITAITQTNRADADSGYTASARLAGGVR
jgi:hypothetical protein